MSEFEYIQPLIIVGCLLYLIYLLFFRQEEVTQVVNKEILIVPEVKAEYIADIVKKEDGYHTEWNEWGVCSKDCGGGVQERNREYISSKYGGLDLSEAERINLIENRNCNEQPCPINGYHTEWSNWGDCDKTCGGGQQVRIRSYIPAKYGGVDLDEAERINLIENRNCNENPCPVNGSFSDWTPWANCDKECGGGNLIRTRTYSPATSGGLDLVDRNILIEKIPCNKHECPFDGAKVLSDGERVDNSTFMIYSPNFLYRLRWNGGLWFVLDAKNNGSWAPTGTLSITSTNTAKSVVASSTSLFLVSTSWTTKVFATSDRHVLYSAITNGGDWVFVRDDQSTSPILKQGQNINLTW